MKVPGLVTNDDHSIYHQRTRRHRSVYSRLPDELAPPGQRVHSTARIASVDYIIHHNRCCIYIPRRAVHPFLLQVSN